MRVFTKTSLTKWQFLIIPPLIQTLSHFSPNQCPLCHSIKRGKSWKKREKFSCINLNFHIISKEIWKVTYVLRIHIGNILRSWQYSYVRDADRFLDVFLLLSCNMIRTTWVIEKKKLYCRNLNREIYFVSNTIFFLQKKFDLKSSWISWIT